MDQDQTTPRPQPAPAICTQQPLAISPILGVIQTLSVHERSELEACEAVLAKGWDAFVAVGRALKKIRSGALYKENYSTFEQYYVAKWGYRRSRVYNLISAAEVVDQLGGLAETIPPTHESQLRPLFGLPAAQAQLVWQCATAKAGGQPLTAQLVKSAIRDLQLTGREGAAADRPPRVDRIALRRALDDAIGELLTMIGRRVSYESLTVQVEHLHTCIQKLFRE